MNSELTEYLLGNLPEQQHQAIADRLITDPDLVGEVESLEVDLIDRYARRELKPADAEKVRIRLLNSPYGQDQLRVAHAFAIRDSKRSGLPLWAAIAASLTLLASGETAIYLSKKIVRPQPVKIVQALPSVVNLDLSATRGNGRVPQISMPPAGPVRFVMHTEAEIPDHAIAHLQTGPKTWLDLPIRSSDKSFQTRDTTLHPGRYEVQVTAGNKLIAAGEFDLVL